MATATLNPAGTTTAGGWTVTGAASAHAALSDTDDSSYIYNNTGANLKVTFDSLPSLPSDVEITAVKIYSRQRGPNGVGAPGHQSDLNHATLGTLTTVYGPVWESSTTPFDVSSTYTGTLTVAQVNALFVECGIFTGASSSSELRLIKHWLEVTYKLPARLGGIPVGF